MSKTDSPFRTLADVRSRNAAQGLHFFDRGTMEFWKSSVESTLIRGRYFITSEDSWTMSGGPARRIFAVRYARDNGAMETLASFLPCKEDALDFIREHISTVKASEVSNG